MIPNFSLLTQSQMSYMETTIASQYAMVTDAPIKSVSLAGLDAHADELKGGSLLPVGSVEFVRKAMGLAGIPEPGNLSYPDILQPYLHRHVGQRRAGSVLGHWFIKPVTTKAFTGFVFDTMENPETLDCHDRIQYNEFLMLSPDDMVWISEPVTWVSEVRYYVIGGEILGWGRYDDGPDEAAEPDLSVISEMAKAMAGADSAPAAFTLDAGVLSTGETALIECNDAWAVGYYKGTLNYKDYVRMLWRRWEQLAGER